MVPEGPTNQSGSAHHWVLPFIAALAALVLIVVVIVTRSPLRTGTMEAVATAEQRAKADGAYLLYWKSGGDQRLEEWEPPLKRINGDVRVIVCDEGWVAAEVVESTAILGSSESAVTAAFPADDLALPGCITRFAVDAMLADLGFAAKHPPLSIEQLTRDPDADPLQPGFHLTPPNGLMNDPQRPVFVDGLWHLYYLYNADYPTGNGTSWFHATSADLVSWTNEGVAIEKFDNGWGDVETGTVVVDKEGTAGFGENTLIAILTQQLDGVQRQSLFYSTDGGYSFVSAPQNPIMENPGVRDWRDPRIIRDAEHQQWVMVLAEGQRLGFYTSADLLQWEYRSDFSTDRLGTLECPDLFPMNLDGDPGQPTWVLAASANGADSGRTTGVAYWTGQWDGERFTVDGASKNDTHRWMDAGPDYYAAVTWDDPRLTASQRADARYSLGWLNNWAYARDVPTGHWSRGAQSIVRVLSLRTRDGSPQLDVEPLPQLDSLSGPTAKLPTDGAPVTVDATSFRVDVDVDPGSRVTLAIEGENNATVTVDLDLQSNPGSGRLETNRSTDLSSAAAPPDYLLPIVGMVDDATTLTVYIDVSSIEVFVHGAGASQSALVGLGEGSRTVRLIEVGAGESTGTVRPLAPVQVRGPS